MENLKRKRENFESDFQGVYYCTFWEGMDALEFSSCVSGVTNGAQCVCGREGERRIGRH